MGRFLFFLASRTICVDEARSDEVIRLPIPPSRPEYQPKINCMAPLVSKGAADFVIELIVIVYDHVSRPRRVACQCRPTTLKAEKVERPSWLILFEGLYELWV